MIRLQSAVPQMSTQAQNPTSASMTTAGAGTGAFGENLLACGDSLQASILSAIVPPVAVGELAGSTVDSQGLQHTAVDLVIGSNTFGPIEPKLSLSNVVDGATPSVLTAGALSDPNKPSLVPLAGQQGLRAANATLGASQSTAPAGLTSHGLPLLAQEVSHQAVAAQLTTGSEPTKTIVAPEVAQPSVDGSSALPVLHGDTPSMSPGGSLSSCGPVHPPSALGPPLPPAFEASTSTATAATGDKSTASSHSAPTDKSTKDGPSKLAPRQDARGVISQAMFPDISSLAIPTPPVTFHRVPSNQPRPSTGSGGFATESVRSTAVAVAAPVTVIPQMFAVSVPEVPGAASMQAHIEGEEASPSSNHGTVQHPGADGSPRAAASIAASALAVNGSSTSLSSFGPDVTTVSSASSSRVGSIAAGPPGAHDNGAGGEAIGSGQVQSLSLQPMMAFDRVAGPQAVTTPHQGDRGFSLAGHLTSEPSLPNQTTVLATPTSLEVGLSGGSQGWLKVRAEVRGENVSATLSSTSSSGTKLLHDQLPALNTFLSAQNLNVSTTISPKIALDGERQAFMQNLSHDRGSREHSPQGHSQPQSQPHRSTAVQPGTAAVDGRSPAEVPDVPPSLMRSSLLADSGSWLNVLA